MRLQHKRLIRKVFLRLLFIGFVSLSTFIQAQHKSRITGEKYSENERIENGWAQIFNGKEDFSVHDIKISPSNPDIIYAAGNGVYRSTNSGVSWDSVGENLFLLIGVDPLNSNVVLGTVSTASENTMYRTTNGGKKWDLLLLHHPTFISFYIFDRSEPEAVYTTLNPDKLYISFDYGTTWENVNFQDTSPAGNTIYSLAIPNDDPNLLYISAKNGVYKSTDRGETWDSLNISTDENYNELFLDPVNSQKVYVLIKDKGIFKSVDGGEEWLEKNNGLRDINFSSYVSLVINPENTEQLYLSADSSLYHSTNGGDSWSLIEPSPPGQLIRSIALDTSSGTRILIGGTLPGIYALDLVTSVEEDRDEQLPNIIELQQNYPNPFNPSTVIQFSLIQSQIVVLEIFDLLGSKVKTLIHSRMSSGMHSIVWDGTNEKGNEMTSGIYIYRLTAGTFIKSKKMILIQ